MAITRRHAMKLVAELTNHGLLEVVPRLTSEGDATSNGYRFPEHDWMGGSVSGVTAVVSERSPRVVSERSPKENHSEENHLNSIYKHRSRIPKDFSLSKEMLVYATSKGIQQPQQEFEKFREYYEAKGTVWLDWVKVWQQWCRNAAERKHDGLYANRNNEREQVAGRDFAPFLEK